MGVIFTQEQVERGRIPRLGDHAEAMDAFLALVNQDGPIEAALGYGSTAYGRATRRSDVDLAIFFDADRERETVETLKDVQAELRRSGNFAPLEMHMEDVVDRGIKHDDPQYTMHLIRTVQERPQWSVGNPLRFLREPKLPHEVVIQDARDFLDSKWRKFYKAEFAERMDFGAYQRALEFPVAVGRKVFSVLQLYGGTEFDTVDKANMQEKALEQLEICNENGVRTAERVLSQHKLLVSRDKEYSELVEGIVTGRSSKEGHELWLTSGYRVAVAAARECAYGWQRVLDCMLQDMINY